MIYKLCSYSYVFDNIHKDTRKIIISRVSYCA